MLSWFRIVEEGQVVVQRALLWGVLFLLAVILGTAYRVDQLSRRVDGRAKAMEQLHKDAQDLDDQVRALEVRMREIREQRESAAAAPASSK
jgi:phage shock protein A